MTPTRYVHVGESHRGQLGTGNVDFVQLFWGLAEINYTGAQPCSYNAVKRGCCIFQTVRSVRAGCTHELLRVTSLSIWQSAGDQFTDYFWKHLEVLLFSLICLLSVKTVQNSENSQYPNASKCFQIAKTVQNSENSKLVSGTLPYHLWNNLRL